MIVTNLVIAFLIGYVSSFDAKSNIASKDLSSGVDAPSVSLIPLQLYSSLFVQGGADDTRQDAGYRCKDTKGREMCIKFKNIGYCDKPKASKKCMETCGLCVANPASCQEKCVADWTGGTPDCIKREACQRACNAGTCPEYNKWIYDISRTP